MPSHVDPRPAAPTAADLDALRAALTHSDYTVDGVARELGMGGQAALARGDLAGAQRALAAQTRCSTLLRIFVLGDAVARAEAETALAPLSLERARAIGLIVDGDADGGDRIAAGLDLRPYGESEGAGALPGAFTAPGSASWWVLSDLGSDVHPGEPVRRDHVLGIGSAALTLAQATPRAAVERALDIGTGCGVQALHLSRHAREVVATDVSPRALALAAATAGLNELSWDLRQGDFLDPVRGEQFDLVVANPPFVVGPGWHGTHGPDGETTELAGFDYRDSGRAGDAVCELLVRQLPGLLAPGGTAQLLANWLIPADGDWAARLASWLGGSGCDAWIWQRELADPGEYVSLWLRDSGESPGTPNWKRRYAQWMEWFDSTETRAVGMGLITLRRTDAERPTVVCEDVRQAVEQPSGTQIADWFDRAAWLRAHAGRLGECILRAPEDLVLTTHALRTADGWANAAMMLRQSGGMRWEIEVDKSVAAFVAGCTGESTVRQLAAVLAAGLGAGVDEVIEGLTPVLSDLIQRGLLRAQTD